MTKMFCDVIFINKLHTTIKCFKLCYIKEQMITLDSASYSHPQYNPTSLCIKEMQVQIRVGTFRSQRKSKPRHLPGQHHLVQKET